MFGSTRQGRESSLRQLAADLWRQMGASCRQASLRAAMFLQGERVDPETLAVTLDGERHLIMGVWSQLAVQAAMARERETVPASPRVGEEHSESSQLTTEDSQLSIVNPTKAPTL